MWWRLALFPVIFVCAALSLACSWLVGEDDWDDETHYAASTTEDQNDPAA